MRCEPANSLISKFGGLTAVARIAEVSVHTVLKWRLPKDRGGTGGAIPHWHHGKLLDAAQALQIEVAPADFFAAAAAEEHAA